MKYLSWRSALFVFMCMGAVPAGAQVVPFGDRIHCSFQSLNSLHCLAKNGRLWQTAEQLIGSNWGFHTNFMCAQGVLLITRHGNLHANLCAKLIPLTPHHTSPLTILSPGGGEAFTISCCKEPSKHHGEMGFHCRQQGKWTDVTPKGNRTVQQYRCQ